MNCCHLTHVSVAVPVAVAAAVAAAEAVAGAAAGAGAGGSGVEGQPVPWTLWVLAGARCPCGKWGKSAAAGTRNAGKRHGRCGRKVASWHLVRGRMFC